MPSTSSKNAFPIFDRHPELVYLDSAATSQKPQVVIDAMTRYYSTHATNVGRGLYPLAEETTSQFEAVREKVARFIGAQTEEIIFTSGTTDGINMVARLLAPVIPIRQLADEGSLPNIIEIPPLEDSVGMTRKDTHETTASANIIVTELEHHSNFLPWKELAKSKGIDFRIAPILPDGSIDIDELLTLVDAQTHIISFSAISNVIGVINPVTDIIRRIKEKNPTTIVIVDAAQAVAHIPINVSKWNADFIAFSGHKMYGPTGIGVLYGKKEILSQCRPTTFGGGMVVDAMTEKTEYKASPYCFEAGTQNVAGVIGLGAAIDFINGIGFEALRSHEGELLSFAIEQFTTTFGETIHILGTNNVTKRSGLISFALDDIHPHDLAHILGEKNICIRAGEHCAAPLHRSLNLSATARISFGIYTETSDIDRLIAGMKETIEILNS